MQYALLGPVQVSDDEGPLEINGTLRRTLLAALLLRPNQVVSADHLAELLWGDRPRVSATSSLYNQVMRLRQSLGKHAGRIRAVPPGYVIDVEPGELDTVAFAEHGSAAARAAQNGDWEASAREYAAALALWRGQPLADIPALQCSAAIQQLGEERILARQGRVEAELRLGRHDQVIGELRTLIDHYPWRETFHGQLMLALYRAGRQPEALDVYRDLRRAIAAEFGVEPSETLRALHGSILRSDPALALSTAEPGPETFSAGASAPRSGSSASSASASAPSGIDGEPGAEPDAKPVAVELPTLPTRAPARQLPADTRAFTGRETELDVLIAAARVAKQGDGARDAAPTVVISAINGMGGIGKTALAVRAAHRLAEHFPDGQLFIDLHGHSADLDPISPQDALDYLLRSIGVDPKAIPQELHERAAFYRSRLAGTRTLIVLDNARNAAQVKPLIPADPGCLVVVTSRNLLTGLDDAEFLSLDALPPEAAVALLSDAAGPGRIDPESETAHELTEWCGRLPLAIRIIGARLRRRRMLSPETLLSALRTDGDPLALFKDEDRDITHVFASSLDVLPVQERRLFARLGLIPGPDFDAYAAAALQDIEVAEAERRLESLSDHGLLLQHKPNRFRLHDLLRAYARVRAAEYEPEENEAARERLLNYYIETTAYMKEAWEGTGVGHRPTTATAGGSADLLDARVWYSLEIDNLIAAFGQESLSAQQKVSLVKNMTPYLVLSAPGDRVFTMLTEAVDAVHSLLDVREEAHILCSLGASYINRGRLTDAPAYFERAAALFREIGDHLGEARALKGLGWAYGGMGDARSVDYAKQAAELLDGSSPLEEGEVLNLLCLICNYRAQFDESMVYTERLLRVSRAANRRRDEGFALFHRSHTVYALGRFDEVEPLLLQALDCQQGSATNVASLRQELGRLRMRQGRLDEAVAYLRQALEGFIEVSFVVGICYACGELGRIELRRGNPVQAMALQMNALKLAVDSAHHYVECFIRANTGYIHIAKGDYAAAEEQLRKSFEGCVRGGFNILMPEARVGLCALIYARDGAATALPHYQETVEFVRRVRHPSELASALVGLGRCELELGDRDSGVAHLHEAISLYQRMGSALDVAETQQYLV